MESFWSAFQNTSKLLNYIDFAVRVEQQETDRKVNRVNFAFTILKQTHSFLASIKPHYTNFETNQLRFSNNTDTTKEPGNYYKVN